MAGRAWALVVGLLWLVLGQRVSAQTILDSFEDVTSWRATWSEGAAAEVARDEGYSGMGMRMDFDLGAGGFATVHRDVPVALPANYTFKLWVRGSALPNSFELKLIGRNGDNVWWYKQHAFELSEGWREIVIKKSRIEFAWGPLGGGPPRDITAIEIAVAAGQGGRGSMWIDELRLEKREVEARMDLPPRVTASTAQPGHGPEMVLDQKAETSWHSGAIAAQQWLLIDLQVRREFGAVIVDWERDDFAVAYDVEASDDGKIWKSLHRCARGNGGRDYVYAPDGESRFLRFTLLESSRGQGYGIVAIYLAPYELSTSPNRFFEMIARDARRGLYPKYLAGEQTYWTIAGVDGDKEALINEEGTVESHRGGFSIEPFLYADGELITWNSVRTAQELEEGYLPIPSVTWQHERVAMRVTAVAAGTPGSSLLHLRYHVENRSSAYRDVTLFLAVRPFQVLPPWQNLNLVGGVSAIDELAFQERVVSVNGHEAMLTQTPPDRFGASTFDEGMITDFLDQGRVPAQTRTFDPFRYASGALMYSLRLDGGGAADVYLTVPFYDIKDAGRTTTVDGAAAQFAAALDRAASYWRRLLSRVEIQLPAAGERIARSIKSTLAYTLINRQGAAIHPGPRTYARAWIRDGAMISAALLEMGLTDEVRDFVRWYAQFQGADGRIPCCIDERGPDRVPEHDSDGEMIFVIAEYYRHTRDVGFLNEQWPVVVKAVEHLMALRAQRLTDEFRQPGKQAFFGILPPSISHEGYSSQPVHSYWDDFFAVRGFKDAAALALVVGDEARAVQYAELRDSFRSDLYASIDRTMRDKKIEYIPGSAELGDYDPTSTAIAVTLGSEYSHVPQAALAYTFEKYWQHVQARRDRQVGDEGYSVYELRNVGALVRLGQRERASELLQMLLADQRPLAWNQWQEITWRDPTLPRFIGDMPHTWVASSLIQSVRSFFAYERDTDQSLVLGAGLPREWVMSAEGVAVKRLPTHFGVVHFALKSEAPNRLRAKISGDLALPPGKIVLQPPLPQPLKRVIVNGQPQADFAADSVRIDQFPAEVTLEY